MEISETINSFYNRLSFNTTNQDLIKAFAFFIMFIDHLGHIIYIDSIILRVIGRTGLPIWFFFVGYNFRPESKFSIKLLVTAILFEIISRYLGKNIIPPNVLFSIVFSKTSLKLYYKYYKGINLNLSNKIIYTLLILVFIPISKIMFEYGYLSILMSFWGYRSKKYGPNKLETIILSLVISIQQIIDFKFSLFNAILSTLFINITIYILYNYKSKNIEINGFLKYLINICSRYSLYLYIIHLILLRIIKRFIIDY